MTHNELKQFVEMVSLLNFVSFFLKKKGPAEADRAI